MKIVMAERLALSLTHAVVQWESGKTAPVPESRQQKLSASRVRSLSSTPVVMSAAFVDLQHTTEEKEGISITNCWKLKEKKEESHEPNNICSIDFNMADDDDIVEHFEILNNNKNYYGMDNHRNR